MTSLKGIENFASVDPADYKACIDVIEHECKIDQAKVNIRMHHLKFDGNGRPMVKALAQLLYLYIIDYCIASKNRSTELTARQAAKLTKEARELFRHPDISDISPDKTGEAGEALLFFLMEAVLKAPQLVAKMELKTNRRDEVKGSDGIHIKWNDDDQIADFYFGESKLYGSVGDAMTDALKSINNFHDTEMYKHEFTMATKHFKYADENAKKSVEELIRFGEPGPSARVNHACLIGYDWEEYSKLKIGSTTLVEDFKEKLLTDSLRITKLLDSRFTKFERKYLCFEVFFIPFPSVKDFRNEFNAALN